MGDIEIVVQPRDRELLGITEPDVEGVRAVARRWGEVSGGDRLIKVQLREPAGVKLELYVVTTPPAEWEAGYDHAFLEGGAIGMHGIALAAGEEATPEDERPTCGCGFRRCDCAERIAAEAAAPSPDLEAREVVVGPCAFRVAADGTVRTPGRRPGVVEGLQAEMVRRIAAAERERDSALDYLAAKGIQLSHPQLRTFGAGT